MNSDEFQNTVIRFAILFCLILFMMTMIKARAACEQNLIVQKKVIELLEENTELKRRTGSAPFVMPGGR